MSKFIQSFYQYPVTFSAIGKTIPARSAQGETKNIAEVTDAEFVKLQNREPKFRELVNQKKYRVLNKLPASYIPAAQQINNARAEADKLREENEALKAQLAQSSVSMDTKESEKAETVEEKKEEVKPVKKAASKKK